VDPYVEIGDFEGKERIFLFTEWEPDISRKCKSVVGYKWHPDYERKPWSYPLRMQTCHALRSVWGDRMQIGPSLTSWARKEAARYSTVRQLARLPDSPLPLVKERFPLMWEAMSKRTYQRSGAAFLKEVVNGCDLDEPGLGKTLTALAALVEADIWDGPHLVISPKTAIFSTWQQEIEKWTDGRAYGMPDGKARREAVLMDFLADEKPGAKFLIVHPNMIQIKLGHYCTKCEGFVDGKADDILSATAHYVDGHKAKIAVQKCDWPELFEEGAWNSVLADEAQKYMLKLRPSAGRSLHKQPQWAHGLRALIKATKADGMRIPMTGTPFRGKEENIFGILHWVDPEKFSSFWAWAGAYLEVSDQEHSGFGDSHKVVGRIKPDAEDRFYDMLDSVAIRRTKMEVRPDIPANEPPQEHWVELQGEHLKQYNEFQTAGIAELESGVVEQLGVLSELTRLRQFAFGPMDVEYKHFKKREIRKVPGEPDIEVMVPHTKILLRPIVRKSPKVLLLMDMLEARGAFGEFESGDRKFVVASQWTSFIDAIELMLQEDKIPCLKITGGVTGKKRDAAVQNFRTPGGPRILLLNTTAGGTSLTLDEYCDEMFILDETWIKDETTQLMARIDNRGQDIRLRMFHFIRTRETVEESIALSNIEQDEMQRRILDKRRGVDVALSLLGGDSVE
jgi:SNF2 family DNA or RNA helicase